MRMKIDFIDASGGGIKMYAGNSLKGWGGTAKGIAYTLRTVGLADRCMASSSMDFASEYGFKNNILYFSLNSFKIFITFLS